ncbi:MAG TPA: histidine phosphatase family protein, partial [Thermoanaerobaculia bacterium]|nr:histidine phosphatase family protein [Thermoanaerobaculia bacterium]
MPRIRLFLVRHGQVSSNRDLRYVGSRDEPLTDLGRRQASALAELMAPLPIHEIRCSPLSRAHDTAAAIAQATGRSVTTEERLREQSYGEWEGMSRDEVRSRSAQDYELLKAWERDAEISPPGGESLLSVQRRSLALVDELLAAADGDAMPWIVLVSHVGPIKALLAASLSLPLDRGGRRIFLDPGTVSVVDWGDPSILRLCNSHAHAGWTSAR